MSTHNLCFGAKIRKIAIRSYKPQFFYIKAGFKGVFNTQTCFPHVYESIGFGKSYSTPLVSPGCSNVKGFWITFL